MECAGKFDHCTSDAIETCRRTLGTHFVCHSPSQLPNTSNVASGTTTPRGSTPPRGVPTKRHTEDEIVRGVKHPRLLRDPCRPSGMIGRGSVHHWQSNEFLPCEERCSIMYATAILLARQHPIYHMSLHDFKQPVERSTSGVFRCQMAQNGFPGSPFASIIRFSPPGPRLV